MISGILFRPEAEADLEEAFRWYEQQRNGLGREFLLAIDDVLQGVTENPSLHPLVYRNIRRAFSRRFPYGVFYLIDGDLVVVLGVFHASRDPSLWRDRI